MQLDNSRGWRPEVGDVLVGEVIGVEKGWSDQAEKFYPIVTVKPDKKYPARVAKQDDKGAAVADEFETLPAGETVAVHCFHAVLYARMVELRPEVGEVIGIKYVKGTEKIKGQKKSTASIYNVKIEGRGADVWGAMELDERVVKAEAKQRELTAAPEDDVTVNASDDDIPF